MTCFSSNCYSLSCVAPMTSCHIDDEANVAISCGRRRRRRQGRGNVVAPFRNDVIESTARRRKSSSARCFVCTDRTGLDDPRDITTDSPWFTLDCIILTLLTRISLTYLLIDQEKMIAYFCTYRKKYVFATSIRVITFSRLSLHCSRTSDPVITELTSIKSPGYIKKLKACVN